MTDTVEVIHMPVLYLAGGGGGSINQIPEIHCTYFRQHEVQWRHVQTVVSGRSTALCMWQSVCVRMKVVNLADCARGMCGSVAEKQFFCERNSVFVIVEMFLSSLLLHCVLIYYFLMGAVPWKNKWKKKEKWRIILERTSVKICNEWNLLNE